MPPDHDRTDEPLTDYVGRRVRRHRWFARRCCEWVIAEAPAELDRETVEEIIRRRSREEYGSVLAAILLPLLLNLVAGLIVEWWRRRNGSWLVRFDAS